MKIPITHAIEAGAWLQCQIGEYNFRIKPNVFERVKLSALDKPDKIDSQYDLKQGDFWLLKFEVISLTKQTIDCYIVKNSMIVIDQDNFEFTRANDSHLLIYSRFSKLSGLNDFLNVTLHPKIRYTGTEVFYLPKEDNAEYFISVSGGNIKET